MLNAIFSKLESKLHPSEMKNLQSLLPKFLPKSFSDFAFQNNQDNQCKIDQLLFVLRIAPVPTSNKALVSSKGELFLCFHPC
jgi:hypothetical protein